MGGTKKNAELRLFLPVDEATLKRSVAAFQRMRSEEDDLRDATAKRIQASRQGLEARVRAIKAESIVSAEAARNVTEHTRAMERDEKATRKAATAQDFYNKAVRNQYGSQGSFLKGSTPGGMASATGGGGRGNGLERGLTTIGQLAPENVGGLFRTAADIAQLGEVLGGVGASSATATAGMSGLSAALGPAAVAAVGLTIAIAAMSAATEDGRKAVSSAADAQDLYFQAIHSMTSGEIRQSLAGLKEDFDAASDSLGFWESVEARFPISDRLKEIALIGPALADAFAFAKGFSEGGLAGGLAAMTEFQEARKRVEEHTEAQRDAAFGSERLTEALKHENVKKRDAAEAAKKQAQETEKLTRASKEVTQAQERQTEAAQKAAQNQQQLANLYQGIVEHGRQAAQQLAKTEDQRLKDILALNQRYAQQEGDELRQRGRQQAAEKRRAAYDERRAEIEGRFAATKLGADRDFAGLADLRDQTSQNNALKALDDEFNAQERRIAEREAAEDKAIQYAWDRASIEQRVNEARVSAAQTELEYMRQVVTEFAKLRAGFGDARFYNEAQIRSVYGAAAGAAGAASLDPSKIRLQVAKRAYGGPLAAGQLSTYNELPGQREAFGGQMLPAGMGMIWPARGGNVTNARGDTTIIVNEARTPELTWREIERKLDERDRGVYY